MIVVTGACGFIGSRVLEGIYNLKPEEKIVAVDYISDENVKKISSFPIYDFISPETFLKRGDLILEDTSCVFHQGAISDTTYKDTERLMMMNHQYTKTLISKAIVAKSKIIYASSAAVYGLGENGFKEDFECESPMNVYGFSKSLVDNWVRHNNFLKSYNIFGLRYFNVYGMGEEHKSGMSSPIFSFFKSATENREIKIFEGSKEYSRDFVYVDDVVRVNLECAFGNIAPGIYNVGSGKPISFYEIANIVSDFVENDTSVIETPFPESLKGRYQKYTSADLGKLRKAGYKKRMTDPKKGISKYLMDLSRSQAK